MLAPEDFSTKRPTLPTREGLAALALYSAGVLAFLGTALLSGGKLVLGDSQSDVWKHLWGAWWMGEELRQGRFPTWTDLQNFPFGGSLYVIDPLNAFLAGMGTPLAGLVQSYNLVMAFQVLAAAMGAWALARYVTGDGRAALVAGAAYGFCPFLLTSGVSSGIAETSNLAWLPLGLLGLLMGFSGSRGPWAVLMGGACLALAALGSWYFGMAALVVTLLLAAWTARTGRPPVPDAPPASWFQPVLACLLTFGLVLPFLVLFTGSLRGEGSLLAQIDVSERMEASSLEFLHRGGNFKNDADLSSYLLPGKSWLSVAEDVDRRQKSVYAGYAVLLLAVAGLWQRRRWTWFWALAAGVLMLLSVGPFLYVAPGKGLSQPWNPVYALAFYTIPGFRMVAIADRFSIAVQLCLAILASAGLARLLPEGRKGTLVAALVASLVLLETALVSPVPWPIPTSSATVPPCVQALASEPGHLGVINLPLNRTSGTLQPGEYYFWQAFHRKPLPIALTTRFPRQMMENRLVGTLYLCEDLTYGQPPAAPALRPGLEQLRASGFGWILVDSAQMHAKSAQKVERVLTGLVGEPQRFEGGGMLYRLGAPAGTAPQASVVR